VLVLMKANTQMKEHHADARISIHTLQGRIRVHLPDQKIELPAGELMALDHGVPHDVEAVEESAFLITIGAAIPGCKWVCLGDYANSRGAADMGLYPDLLPGYIPLSHGAAFREAWDAEFPTQSGLNLLQMMEAAKGGLLKVGNLHEHLR